MVVRLLKSDLWKIQNYFEPFLPGIGPGNKNLALFSPVFQFGADPACRMFKQTPRNSNPDPGPIFETTWQPGKALGLHGELRLPLKQTDCNFRSRQPRPPGILNCGIEPAVKVGFLPQFGSTNPRTAKIKRCCI
jgi:hypothetical protein